ncbi:MAG: CocE/NonD family hydrolase [Alphaproteobacteria bacterium]|nr:CocE/NonD family hydrolase [Alphaproteobacteria bacterium]
MPTAAATIEVRETVWIPLADGRRLAARLWLPAAAATAPAPAIVEYMPYRRRDATRSRDEPIHAWFAAHGYASLRVDMHGSGDSDGILRQEFQKQEQDDALEIVAWIAAQPWCSGAVAMFGKSWGAFAALQAAMRRPPALKAVIAVCGAQDRYDESLHFTGGAPLVEQLWWSDTMMLFNMRPPDPAIVGERWREMWRARLEANEPWLGEWLKHQTRDKFWKHGSVADDPGSIACPVFAVGGWADYISRAVPRLLAALGVPRWGLIGPWGHHYPQDGIPAPAIGFLQECDRFLRFALRGDATAMDRVPMLRAWMPEQRTPGPDHAPEQGRWVAEQSWPSPRITPRAWHLGASGLTEAPAAAAVLYHRSPQSLGATAPEWLSMGLAGEAPRDQREDDGRSLTFDTEPLVERIEILGTTELAVEIETDQPVATLVARLCDVAPDGTSLRVSLGVLNLTHRTRHDRVTPMPVGKPVRVRLRFPDVAHCFRPGHRIRLAIGTAYWPVLWPSPAPVALRLHTRGAYLTLPIRPLDPANAAGPRFAPPEAGEPTPITILEPATMRRTHTRDLADGTCSYALEAEGGYLGPGRRHRIDSTGTELGHRIARRFAIRDDDPLSARAEFEQSMEIGRSDWQVRLETSTRFHATATAFHATCRVCARDGDRIVHEREWTFAVPRRGT